MECKKKGDTSNNRGDWDYLKVIQKIREQHTRKTTGTTEKQPYWALHTHSESTNVKIQ